MTDKKTASLFTGGGGFEIGAIMAGYKPVWGVEIRPDIAAVAERNIPGLRVIVSDVAAVDYASLPGVDHLHASPSCKNASIASDGEEAPEDLSSAMAICRALREVRPACFTLENVWGYREFESFKLVVGQLTRLGYKVDWWHLNAADYGVPQTRKRLILIARLACGSGDSRFEQQQPRKPAPTHSKTPDPWGLYKPWVGWLEAISDLVDTLPESEFAPWQLERLPAELKSMLLAQGGYEGGIVNRSRSRFTVTSNSNQAGVRAYLVDQTNHRGDGGKSTIREEEEPVWTIPVYSPKHPAPRALLIPGDNASNGVTRAADEPMVTIQSRGLGQCPHRAYVVGQNYGSPNDNGKERKLNTRLDNEPIFTIEAQANRLQTRAFVGRVVKMTPRALARFQSFPDDYVLPETLTVWTSLDPGNGLACEIIGNAVSPLLAKAICNSL